MKENFWNKDYLLLLQGGAVSAVGDVLYTTAISYSVLEQTGSTAAMSIVSAIPMFTTLFLMSFAGSVADRANRKTIITFMDALRGVVMIATGLLAVKGQLSLAVIYAVTVVCSLAKVVFSPAVTVAFVDVIPKDQLMRGQSLQSAVMNMSALLGEAVSGGLINIIGIPFTIVLNGISFLFSAFTELFITLPKPAPKGNKQKTTALKDVSAGLKVIFENPNLRIILPTALMLNLICSGASRLTMPLVLENGMGMEHYGLIMSAGSAGVMICTVILRSRSFSPKTNYFIMRLGIVINAVFYIAFCLSHSFQGFFTSQLIMRFGNGMFNAVLNSAMIKAMPADKRGVITGIISSVSTGSIAVSTIIYGFAGDVFPLKAVFLTSAVLVILPFAIPFTSKNIKELITAN